LENIRSGDPMKVYKEAHQGSMFLSITFNNLMVDLIVFVSGIFFAIGTMGAIVYNGIMIGSFQYFFYEQGVFQESFFTIWLHGTLEISTIILAGGAGLTLGKGLVFPGTYSRIQAFRLSARRGLKIMVGVAPITIFAALIESFLTRYTDVPDFVRGLLIFISLVFVLGYFVIYPIRRARKGIKQPEGDSKLSAALNTTLEFESIKTTGEIFRDIFIVFRQNFRYMIWTSLAFSLAYAAYVVYYCADKVHYRFKLWRDPVDNTFRFFGDLFSNYLNYEKFPELILPNLFMCSTLAFMAMYFVNKAADPQKVKMGLRYIVGNYYKPLLAGIFVTLTLSVPEGWGIFLFFVLLPVYLLWQFIMTRERNILFAFGKSFSYGFGLFGRTFGLYLILLLVTFMFMTIISSQYITWKVFEIINWNVPLGKEAYWNFFVGFYSFIAFAGLNLILCMFVTGSSLLYFTCKEIREAVALRKRIALIGKKRSTRISDVL
ncbi:MAG: stage II sporulation protein M, partial [Bacteroidota bacterium]